MSELSLCTNYYPFGMQMPGRGGKLESSAYRYGYQGSEVNQEVYNNRNQYTTEFRQLYARLGRWMTTDPEFFAHQSSYNSMDADPINYNDVMGNSIKVLFKKDKKEESDEEKVVDDADRLNQHFTDLFQVKKKYEKTDKEKGHKKGDFVEDEDGNHVYELSEAGKLLINSYNSELGEYTSINPKKFKKALEGLSEDQKQLAFGYYVLINDEKITQVHFMKEGETLITSELGPMRAAGKYVPDIMKQTITAESVDKSGGGIFLPGASNSIINGTVIINPDFKFEGDVISMGELNKQNVNLNKHKNGPSTFNEILAHELVGHGAFEYILASNASIDMPYDPKNNRFGAGGISIVSAIQVSNIVKRIEYDPGDDKANPAPKYIRTSFDHHGKKDWENLRERNDFFWRNKPYLSPSSLMEEFRNNRLKDDIKKAKKKK